MPDRDPRAALASTITTEVCAAFLESRARRSPSPQFLEIDAAVKKVEAAFGGKKFGDPADPFAWLSPAAAGSGAALSMPGMMNTILNLGLTDASVEGLAKKTGNPRFAYEQLPPPLSTCSPAPPRDGLRTRAVRTRDPFAQAAEGAPSSSTDLTTDDLKELVSRYKAVLQEARRRRLPAGAAQATDARDQRRLQLPGTATRRSSTAASSASRG